MYFEIKSLRFVVGYITARNWPNSADSRVRNSVYYTLFAP